MGKKVEQPAQHLVRFNLNIFADIRLICETTRPNERNLVVVFDNDDKLPKSPASRREASQRRASHDEAETQPVHRKQGVGRSSPAAVSTQRESGDGKRNGKKSARTSSKGRGGVLCDITKEFEIADTDIPCQDQPSPTKAPPARAESQPVRRKQGVGSSSTAAVSTQRDSGDGKRNGKKPARTSSEGRGGVLRDITKEFEITETDTPCQDQPSPTKASPAREPLAEVLQYNDGEEEKTETPSLTESNVNDDQTFQTQPVAAKRTLLADQSSSQNHLGELLAKVLQYNDGEEKKTETPNLSKSSVNDDTTFQTPPLASKQTLPAGQSSSRKHLGFYRDPLAELRCMDDMETETPSLTESNVNDDTTFQTPQVVSKQTRLAGQSSSQNHLGLKNPGLMCYMNASLQALAAAEPFRSYLIEANITREESKEVYNIALVIENIPAAKPVKEKRVKPEYLWTMNRTQFNLHNDVQQDAHEYITRLITLLDDELQKFRKINLSEDLFYSTCLMLPCFCEGACKRNVTPIASKVKQVIMMLDIPEVENDENDKSITVQDLIDESLKTKIENRCCSLSVTVFSIFTQLPKVLIVCLKRYTTAEKKIDRYITASSDLVLSEFRCDEGKIKEFTSNKHSREKSTRLGHLKKKYKLVGIVNHIGTSVKSGHYKAGVFNAGEGAWYEVNDEKVTLTDMSSMICNSAKSCYLLVYVVVEGVGERVRSLTINSGGSSEEKSSV